MSCSSSVFFFLFPCIFFLILAASAPSSRYLETKHDMELLKRGYKLLLRLASTEPLASAVVPNELDSWFANKLLLPNADLEDPLIERHILKLVETLYHPTCTARMAPLEGGGVVDAYLRVHGTSNLRVVDASVFPTIPSGHTVSR